MDLGIRGRVAMVAAASKGLGRAAAAALAAEGCRVSICARNARAILATAREIGALATSCDVTVAEDLVRWHAETTSELGPVDILVTNTGGPPVARFLDLDEPAWRSGIDSTLMNVVRLTKLVAPSMRARRWGRIVHLTSYVARQPDPVLTISSTLRAGLTALTKSLATELGPDGITVNALLPGSVLTERQEHLAEIRMKERGITREEYFTAAAAEIPLRRLGRPEEIGDVICFVASERASYLTGAAITVDGGLVRGI